MRLCWIRKLSGRNRGLSRFGKTAVCWSAPLLCLGCAGQSKPPTRVDGVSTVTKKNEKTAEDCSWENVQQGNENVDAGNFDAALKIFMKCPNENLPNLVGLAADYPPAREALVELADRLEGRLKPPQIDENLEFLVEVLDALELYDRVYHVYQRYIAAGFDETTHGWAFYAELADGGYFAEALRSEHLYRDHLRHAIDEYRACPTAEALSAAGLMLSDAVSDYVEPLVGVGRVFDANCLLHLFEIVSPKLAETAIGEVLEQACAKRSNPVACKESLDHRGAAPGECPVWMNSLYSG